jgi:hypothetical protein
LFQQALRCSIVIYILCNIARLAVLENKMSWRIAFNDLPALLRRCSKGPNVAATTRVIMAEAPLLIIVRSETTAWAWVVSATYQQSCQQHDRKRVSVAYPDI